MADKDSLLQCLVSAFARHYWMVSRTATDCICELTPPGTLNYKKYLLSWNAARQTWQLVGRRQTNDTLFAAAQDIFNEALEATSDRASRNDCDRLSSSSPQSKHLINLSIIKVPSMFPVKISEVKWINLAEIREASLKDDGGLLVVWNSGEFCSFDMDERNNIMAALEEAEKIAFKRLAP